MSFFLFLHLVFLMPDAWHVHGIESIPNGGLQPWEPVKWTRHIMSWLTWQYAIQEAPHDSSKKLQRDKRYILLTNLRVKGSAAAKTTYIGRCLKSLESKDV